MTETCCFSNYYYLPYYYFTKVFIRQANSDYLFVPFKAKAVINLYFYADYRKCSQNILSRIVFAQIKNIRLIKKWKF